jgi:hypothetical protein
MTRVHDNLPLIVLLGLAGLACSCSEPRRFEVDLQWKNNFTWDDVDSSGDESEVLTTAEIDTVKAEALETLKAAFEQVRNVHVSTGDGKARDRIEVHNIRGMALGLTDRLCLSGACPPSRIDYDLHMILAQRYGAQLRVTERGDVTRAIGRGIGNTAAHEFGHRHRLARMDQMTDPKAFTYSDDHPSLFYGDRLYWPRETLEDMRIKVR